MIIIENLNSLSISVSDLDDSISFYKDIFGFDIIERQSGSDEAIMQMGEIILRLCQVADLSDDLRKENYFTFYVDEEDFDDALEEIEENELEIVYGPENLRNGRQIIICDPDGNRMGLSSISR